MRFWGWCIPLGILFAWPHAKADTLAYVRGTSQHDAKSAKFHPINLIDDDPATAWCEGAEGLGEGEEIRIFFKRPQKIDRVIVGPTLRTGRTIQEVQISDGVNTIELSLGTDYVEQKFSPPMRGDKYTLRILEVGPANKAGAEVNDDVACLADFMMYFKKKPFGGRTKPSSFRYNKYRDRILGSWNGEPMGAPEKFMTFALDGTWSWRFTPLMGGRARKMNGEYRFRGNRLLMRKGETGRWSDMRFKFREVDVNPDDPGAPNGDYSLISFNDAIDDKLGGDYNNAEF